MNVEMNTIEPPNTPAMVDGRDEWSNTNFLYRHLFGGSQTVWSTSHVGATRGRYYYLCHIFFVIAFCGWLSAV